MTSALVAWQARNDEYLAAALAQLRQRLEIAARAERTVSPRAGPSIAAAAVPLDNLSVDPGPAGESESPPALLMLARRLGLTDFERQVLLLCIAPEIDTRIAALCAAAQGQPDREYPTFALAMTLFQDPAWDVLSPARPLRYWRLVEINQPGARALTASALRSDERIANFVKGLNYLDDRLASLVTPMARQPIGALPNSQRVCVETLLGALDASPVGHAAAPTVIAVCGRDRTSKQQVVRAAADALGMLLHRLPSDSLPVQAGEIEMLARLWHRESLLLPVMLYLDAHEVERAGGPDSPLQRMGRFIARTGGLLVVDSRDGLPLPVESVITLDVAKPTPAEQHAEWVRAVGKVAPRLPAQLAAQFDLNQSDIEEIVRTAVHDNARPLPVSVWSGCLSKARPQLERLGQRVDSKATWKQLVLPAAEESSLRQIAAQVRARTQVYDDWGFRARMNRGLGISALFAGESGTGKTMAAEVIANELGLDLYRIDLSAIVSKYIGETEKNLRQVFDAAESGGAILFFDEADALFGARSEVKDSHDRYANIEINYLLQRVEAFSGLAILATNMKSALDAAFVRRLRFIVNFPYPGTSERQRIWERVFPRDTPLGVIDYDRLARLHLSGGNIHSVALNAAFKAAHAGTSVTMNVLLDAARMEVRKLDRPVNDADFRWDEVAAGACT